MNAERWQQIEELFHAALACEPGLRPAFLASRCGADKVLRSEVESLLSSHESADDFIETPAGDVAAELLGAQAALEAVLAPHVTAGGEPIPCPPR